MLTDSLPDLVLLLRRDGSVATHCGGHGIPHVWLDERGQLSCSAATAVLLRQLVRRGIAQRAPIEARFQEQSCDYEVRITPQGPDRVIGVIRVVLPESRDDALDASGNRPRPELDRRGFLRRLRESMSLAALREDPLTLVVLYLDGVADIAQIIGPRTAEQVLSQAFLRLSAQQPVDDEGRPTWYLGQLSDSILALVLSTADREAIEASVGLVCASLREPIGVGDADFHLTPYAGVGILGANATTPKMLLEQARTAATEARRSAATVPLFYSDTLQVQLLARLDLARELGEAIANGEIRCRYVPRHDLSTGRLVAWMGYLRWQHPLRGEIAPAQFLRVASSTGQSVTLSRMMLDGLCKDFASLRKQAADDVRLSFGALREHVFHDEFLTDLQRTLADGDLPAERLELRISEKTFVTLDPTVLHPLHKAGVQLVVDEVGRDMSSLVSLARSPAWGLQLDRAWVTAVRSDAIARKVCRAGIAMATALGLTPIATGVDDDAQRVALLDMGCRYGSGDLYSQSAIDIMEPPAEPEPAAKGG